MEPSHQTRSSWSTQRVGALVLAAPVFPHEKTRVSSQTPVCGVRLQNEAGKFYFVHVVFLFALRIFVSKIFICAHRRGT